MMLMAMPMTMKMSPTSCLLRAALLLGGYALCSVSSAVELGVDTATAKSLTKQGLRVDPLHQQTLVTREKQQQTNDWIIGQFTEPVDSRSGGGSSIHDAPRSNGGGRSADPNRRAALSITTTAESDASDIGECILLFGAFCNGECFVGIIRQA